MIISCLKEIYDDIQRRIKDNEINGVRYGKLLYNGGIEAIEAAEIKVGDIIKVNEGQRIPADMVLLYTTEKNGILFIKTDQLDGETDWKMRKSVDHSQREYANGVSLVNLKAHVIAELPRKDIYKFEGTFHFEYGLELNSVGLDLSNTLWADTVITSGFALALVIYTGIDTKSQLNARAPRSKVGRVDKELSRMSFILFLMLLAMATILVLSNGLKGRWQVLFMKFVLLLSSIIPISLRVNLDLAKMWYSYNISHDTSIPGTIARNMMIPEDLGRVEMILSDKTGTLTQNDMEFKAFFVGNGKYAKADSFNEILEFVRRSAAQASGPMADIENMRVNKKRNRGEQIKDLILSMAICHNVTPLQKDNMKTYQAASPDEVALVRFASELGYELTYRDQLSMHIATPNGDIDEYTILRDFPFSSETKKMGIIVQQKKDGKIVYFLKGAEQALEPSLTSDEAYNMKEGAEDLSLEGLRTLSFAEKYLTEEEYEQWNRDYEVAAAALHKREEEKARVRKVLEEKMTYLGVSGVEDKLQENIARTLEGLKQAGIKVWMLTGDKVETASCVGISSGLKSRSEKYEYMKNIADDKYIIENTLKVS